MQFERVAAFSADIFPLPSFPYRPTISGTLQNASSRSVRVVNDKKTGAPRGIAFVDFGTGEEVEKAMKRNGKKASIP